MPRGQFPAPDSTQRMAPPNGRMWGGITNAGAKYAPQLITYSIIFLFLFITAYYLFIYKKVKIHPGNERMLILTLLCAGLLLRISSATLMEGQPFDINLFKSWATTAANNLFQVYSSPRSSDYPPLYMYILFLIGKAASFPAMSPYFTLLLKLPSIAADIATSYLIYKLARKYLSPEISILLSAFYIFNPAVFINSTFWGQVDSFFTFIVISSVVMLSEEKIGLSSALFTAAVMMKPQGIIFLPVLFFELVRQKSFISFLKTVVFSLSTAVIIMLPFSLNKDVLWIYRLFSNTVAEYPYASVNAFNFFSLIGKNYAKDADALFVFSYHSWGMIFIVLITAFSWFIYMKGNNRIFASAAALLQIAGVFTFSTRMHERYLFPAVALSILAFIYLKDKRLLLLSAGFSSTVYINTHYVLFETGRGVNHVPFDPVLILTSLLNILLFIYLVKVIFDIAVSAGFNGGGESWRPALTGSRG
jgi:Gpi18-like mannosyltransferase